MELRPEELHQGVLRRARREPNLQAVDAAAQMAALPVPTTDRLLADGAKWGLVRGAVARSLLPRFGGTQSTVASSADIVSVAPAVNRGPTQDERLVRSGRRAHAPTIGPPSRTIRLRHSYSPAATTLTARYGAVPKRTTDLTGGPDGKVQVPE